MAKPREKNGLNHKQRKFAYEYIKDLNIKQAAIRAGYSEKTAHAQGSRLLKHVKVSELIESLQSTAEKKAEFDHETLIATLKRWVESDITQTISLNTEEIKELPLEVRQLITEYKIESKILKEKYSNHEDENPMVIMEERVQLKFVSKEKAAEMLAKYYGIYERDNEQKNKVLVGENQKGFLSLFREAEAAEEDKNEPNEAK